MKNANDVLKALRSNVEGPPTSDGFRDVYLDNARDLSLTPHQFAAYLSVLEQRGLYRTLDNYAFGQVKMGGGVVESTVEAIREAIRSSPAKRLVHIPLMGKGGRAWHKPFSYKAKSGKVVHVEGHWERAKEYGRKKR